jgi:hypothetical protein
VPHFSRALWARSGDFIFRAEEIRALVDSRKAPCRYFRDRVGIVMRSFMAEHSEIFRPYSGELNRFNCRF